MAYQFAGTSSQYLSASNPVSAAPLTIAAWAWIDNTTGNKALACLNQTSGTNRFALYFAGSTLSFFVNDATGFSQPQAGSAVSANTWNHCVGVESSATSRAVWLNGTQSTVGQGLTTSRSPQGINAINLGTDRVNNANGSFLSGRLCEVGVWNVALGADEIGALSKGVSCDQIRPQSLVFYAPLIRELHDLAGGRAIANNNTATVAVHPRIYA